MRRLRIGVVGAGMIGRRHVATIEASGDAELCGVADLLPADDPYVRSLRAPYFASHRELLAATKPDAVVIASPNRLHVPMGVDCARAGVHMLVEKPIADTVELACELLREAKRAGVRILVGHHRRHHAQAQEARRIVAEGRLGRLVPDRVRGAQESLAAMGALRTVELLSREEKNGERRLRYRATYERGVLSVSATITPKSLVAGMRMVPEEQP